MLKTAAKVFGVVFVLIGVLGFVPGITTTDSMGMPLLLGIFMVGALHNIIHLASGAVGLVMSSSESSSKLYFQIFGAVYVVVTILGFIGQTSVLGILPVNTADNFLHLALAVSMSYLGFVAKPSLRTA